MPLYFIVALMEFYTGLFRLLLIVKLLAIVCSLFFIKGSCKNGGVGFILFIILINVISLPLCLADGRPIECYTNEILNYVVAMFWFFVGASSLIDASKFYKYMYYAIVISFGFGLLLYVSTPGWYVSRLVEWANNSLIAVVEQSESSILSSSRFQSYLMSEYAVSHFTIFGLAIALFQVFKKNNIDTPRLSFVKNVAVLILLICAIISQMRVAMFCSIALLFFYMIYDLLFGRSGNTKKILFICSIILIVIIYVSFIYFPEQIELIINLISERFEDLSIGKALKGREFQVNRLMENWNSPIVGHGLGAGGAIARLKGFPGVTDQNYIKILYENGLMGFLVFLLLILKTMIRAIIHYKYLAIEIVIISFVMVAMLGSNTLSFSYLYIIPFWFAIGRVWNNTSLLSAKKCNLKL